MVTATPREVRPAARCITGDDRAERTSRQQGWLDEIATVRRSVTTSLLHPLMPLVVRKNISFVVLTGSLRAVCCAAVAQRIYRLHKPQEIDAWVGPLAHELTQILPCWRRVAHRLGSPTSTACAHWPRSM